MQRYQQILDQCGDPYTFGALQRMLRDLGFTALIGQGGHVVNHLPETDVRLFFSGRGEVDDLPQHDLVATRKFLDEFGVLESREFEALLRWHSFGDLTRRRRGERAMDPATPRKKRTRDHVIAELAINWVERQILLCGYSFEKPSRDYGLDLSMNTYSPSGEVEAGEVLFQVKATERLKIPRAGSAFPFRVGRSDLVTWMFQFMPVILAVYDVAAERAYWLYVQAHCEKLPGFNLFGLGKTITLHIPTTNVLDDGAVRVFREYRDRITGQFPKRLNHED